MERWRWQGGCGSPRERAWNEGQRLAAAVNAMRARLCGSTALVGRIVCELEADQKISGSIYFPMLLIGYYACPFPQDYGCIQDIGLNPSPHTETQSPVPASHNRAARSDCLRPHLVSTHLKPLPAVSIPFLALLIEPLPILNTLPFLLRRHLALAGHQLPSTDLRVMMAAAGAWPLSLLLVTVIVINRSRLRALQQRAKRAAPHFKSPLVRHPCRCR